MSMNFLAFTKYLNSSLATFLVISFVSVIVSRQAFADPPDTHGMLVISEKTVYLGTPEKARSTVAQLVSAIETR